MMTKRQRTRFSVAPASVLAVGLVALWLGLSHFLHTYQPTGEQIGIPGRDYIPSRTLSEVPSKEFVRGSGESNLHFASRMTSLVHSTTYLCAPESFSLSAIEISVKVITETILHYDYDFQNGLVDLTQFRCGFCHQRAIVLSNILRANGIDAWAFGLVGHVVTRFKVDNLVYISDADYGVPPFLYRRDRILAIQPELLEMYKSVSESASESVIEALLSIDNNEDYFSPDYFSEKSDNRKILFLLSDYIAALFVAISLVIILWSARSIRVGRLFKSAKTKLHRVRLRLVSSRGTPEHRHR